MPWYAIHLMFALIISGMVYAVAGQQQVPLPFAREWLLLTGGAVYFIWEVWDSRLQDRLGWQVPLAGTAALTAAVWAFG